MEQRKMESINQFSGKIEQQFKWLCNKYKYLFAPGTLGILPDTYLVPVSHIGFRS